MDPLTSTKVEGALKRLAGVWDAVADWKPGNVVVLYDPAKTDIEALKAIMQTYMLFDITKYISELPRWKGAAIVLDDNSERIYKLRVRPRQSWHAGSSPTAA